LLRCCCLKYLRDIHGRTEPERALEAASARDFAEPEMMLDVHPTATV
jgi:hypothetical protein